MIRLIGIAIRNRPGAPMENIDSAQVSLESGILGELLGEKKDRQITLLSAQAWRQACAEVDAELPWTTRRANLLLDGVEFDQSWVGRHLHIGEVEFVVTQETGPCCMMEARHEGLTAALRRDWRGGICCDVVSPGQIKLGDQLKFA